MSIPGLSRIIKPFSRLGLYSLLALGCGMPPSVGRPVDSKKPGISQGAERIRWKDAPPPPPISWVNPKDNTILVPPLDWKNWKGRCDAIEHPSWIKNFLDNISEGDISFSLENLKINNSLGTAVNLFEKMVNNLGYQGNENKLIYEMLRFIFCDYQNEGIIGINKYQYLQGVFAEAVFNFLERVVTSFTLSPENKRILTLLLFVFDDFKIENWDQMLFREKIELLLYILYMKWLEPGKKNSYLEVCSEDLGLSGIRREVMKSHRVYVEEGFSKNDLSIIRSLFNAAMGTNGRSSLFKFYFVPPGPKDEIRAGGDEVWLGNYGIGLSPFESYIFGFRQNFKRGYPLNRFEGIIEGIPVDQFIQMKYSMAFFHELGHVLHHNSFSLQSLVRKVYSKIEGSMDPLNWLGDYHYNQRTLIPDAAYCTMKRDFHGMAAEGMSIDTQQVFDVCLNRAQKGYFAPLAIFLITLYSLRTEENTFRFYKTNIYDNDVQIAVQERKIEEVYKLIPQAYFTAMESQFGIDFNNFNLPLLIWK